MTLSHISQKGDNDNPITVKGGIYLLLQNNGQYFGERERERERERDR